MSKGNRILVWIVCILLTMAFFWMVGEQGPHQGDPDDGTGGCAEYAQC